MKAEFRLVAKATTSRPSAAESSGGDYAVTPRAGWLTDLSWAFILCFLESKIYPNIKTGLWREARLERGGCGV